MKNNFKIYGVIGKPLSHSLSPLIHNYWFKIYGIQAEYKKLEISEEDISNTLKDMRNKQILGLNVTIPYKYSVVKYLDNLVEDAKITGSVNTIYLNTDGSLVGDNSDVYGFERGFLNKLKIQNLNNCSALVVGAGGVSSSIIWALKKKGFKKIYVSNRTQIKIDLLKTKFPNLVREINWKEKNDIAGTIDVLVNATSLGMTDHEDLELDVDKFKKSIIVFDAVYNPQTTNLVKKCNNRNIKAFGGLDMFVYQAIGSFYKWHKKEPKFDEEIKNLIKSVIN